MKMKKNVFFHTVFLLAAIILTFFWVTDETLTLYSLQLTGILLLFLIISHRLMDAASFKLVESVVATIAVLLVVNATGGVNSPFF